MKPENILAGQVVGKTYRWPPVEVNVTAPAPAAAGTAGARR